MFCSGGKAEAGNNMSQIYLFFARNCWLIDSEQRLHGNTSSRTSQWQKLQYVKKKKQKFVEPKGSSLVRFDELSHVVAVVVFFFIPCDQKKKKNSWFLLSERKTKPDISNKHQRGWGNRNRRHTVGTKWKTTISSGHNFCTVPLHFRI